VPRQATLSRMDSSGVPGALARRMNSSGLTTSR
jgi:hypothetical protein